MKRLGLLALLLCSFSVAAGPMFPSIMSCMEAGSGCALALKDNFLVDVKSGQRFSVEAESAGAMSGFWLYRDGERYILENENYSQAKSRRWLVFTYDGGKVLLDGAYIFSIDIDPNTGPYWHGYDCEVMPSRSQCQRRNPSVKLPWRRCAVVLRAGWSQEKTRQFPYQPRGWPSVFPFITPATVMVQQPTCLLKAMFRIFRS